MKRCGLLGRKLGHSYSPRIHEMLADYPYLLYEKEPEIRGVIVVAEGAADVSVRLDLQRAVCAVLNVPISAVEVFERIGTSAAAEPLL